MAQLTRTVLWRSMIDGSLDRCVFTQGEDGWIIEGKLHMLIELEPVNVNYRVECGPDWITRSATARWREGLKVRALEISTHNGIWFANGIEQPQVAGAVDVDLGLTPATNTLPIRRLQIPIGQSADVTAAWVRFPELTLEPLPQKYTRLDEDTYRYESYGGVFTAELEVDELGIITRYERGWDRVLIT